MDHLFALFRAHREALLWISWGSAGMFVLSLLLVPLLIARAPSDFFVRPPKRRGGAWWLLVAVLRNAVGVALLISGLLMLVLPGQGLLMVVLALTLLDVPGKRALIERIVRKPPVWRALAFLRKRTHKPPFERPGASGGAGSGRGAASPP